MLIPHNALSIDSGGILSVWSMLCNTDQASESRSGRVSRSAPGS